MGRVQLRRRYLSLGLGELAAAATLLGAYWLVLPRLAADTAAVGVVLAGLIFLLLQGAGYWLLARSWIPTGTMPAHVARLFGWLRVANVLVLVGAAVVVAGWGIGPGRATWLGVGLWLFTVAEYVNYFWVRLSYPPSGWWRGVRAWRASRLAIDLARAA